MLRLNPSARFPRDAFANYDTAAPVVRATLGVDRLSRAVAAEVRAAVARHADRAARRAAPVKPIGMDLAAIRGRLRAETETAVGGAFRGLYRVYESKVRVAVGDAPQVSVDTSTKWVSGKRGFGRVSDGQTNRITVCPAWRRRVLARGLARLDGLLTTHATPVLGDGEITVYRAAWVRQGRGYNLTAQTGLIAFHPATGTAYHATDATPEQAVRSLRRKLRSQAVPDDVARASRDAAAARRAERRAAKLSRLVDRIARWDLADVGGVVVTRADSLRAGNCEPGTDQFIDRFVPGRESATIAEIARAVGRIDPATLAAADLTLARQIGAACLVAIRHDKQARRLVLA